MQSTDYPPKVIQSSVRPRLFRLWVYNLEEKTYTQIITLQKKKISYGKCHMNNKKKKGYQRSKEQFFYNMSQIMTLLRWAFLMASCLTEYKCQSPCKELQGPTQSACFYIFDLMDYYSPAYSVQGCVLYTNHQTPSHI